jgi:hypothetical protein
MCAVAYTVLQARIIAHQGSGSRLAAAVKGDLKGKVSMAMYAVAIPLAFFDQRLSDAIFVAVALMWLIPDRRIERRLHADRDVGAGRAGGFGH